MRNFVLGGRLALAGLSLLLGLAVLAGSPRAAESGSDAGAAPRVIDGTLVDATTYPNVVKIELPNGSFGTGTLVRPSGSTTGTRTRTILTAGHVLTDGGTGEDDGTILFLEKDVVVVLNGLRLTPKAFAVHPKWRGRSMTEKEPDLAVIQLADFPSVTPAELSAADVVPPLPCTVVGYGLQGTGATGSNGTTPPAGKVNRGNVVVNATETTFMTAIFEEGASPAQCILAGGDSGGPAFNMSQQVAGVAHASQEVFGGIAYWARVDTERDWIENSLRIQTTDTVTGTVVSATALKAAAGFIFSKPLKDKIGMVFEFVSQSGEQPLLNTTFSYSLGGLQGSFFRDEKGKVSATTGPNVLKFAIKARKKEHLHFGETVKALLTIGPGNLANRFQLQAAGLPDLNTTTDSAGVVASTSGWLKIGSVTYRALGVTGAYKAKENKKGLFKAAP